MAQRMLVQWQQHSAEETIYIILCVHTGMSVWLRANKREAVRKRGILCLSIIVCGPFLTHKNPPYCYSTFLYMSTLSPSLFYTSCWFVSWRSLALFLFCEAPWPSHSPFCSLFLFQDTGSTRLFTFQPSCRIKSPPFESLMKNVLCVLTSLILGINGKYGQTYLVVCLVLFLTIIK